MNNILLKVNKDINLYPNETNGFMGYILGLEKYSICFGKTYSIDEIKDIKEKYSNRKIFVSLNRVIFNSELDDYKRVLKKLDEIGLDGIIIGDVAALTYNLSTNIILDQLHLNNNYLTAKHYHNNNTSGIYLTNDITLVDINKIKQENKNLILFKQAFGLPHLSTSKRFLTSNYLKYFNKEKKSNIHLIKENNTNDYYYIVEDDFGTHILDSKPLNLLCELENIHVDYFIIDDYLISDIDLNEIVDIYSKNKKEKQEYINTKYNANNGFINKDTIYKVKNNE